MPGFDELPGRFFGTRNGDVNNQNGSAATGKLMADATSDARAASRH